MNIGLISVIVALAVLLLKLDYSSKRINEFLKLYNKSLSDLEEAKFRKIEGKIVDDETTKINRYYHEGAIEINKYYKDFKKGYDRLKWIECLKQIVPILLLIEILHLTLQEFGWSLWYEKVWPGLNGGYVVFIILLMLSYLVLGQIRMTDKKILDLESKIFSVIANKIYDFL